MSAVAMLSSGAAYAAVVDADPDTAAYSLEGLKLAGGEVPLPDITVTFENNLGVQDDIYITIIGATAGSTPVNIGNVTCTGTDVGYAETVGNTFNFYIADPDGATAGAFCTFSGLTVTAASLAASTATEIDVKVRRFITGQLLDSGRTDGLTEVTSQFAINELKKLDAVIDVFADRTQFVFGDPTSTDDTLEFTTTVDAGLPVWAGPYVDATKGTVAIIGDWTWADDDGDGNCAEDIGGYAVPTASLTYVPSKSSCTQAVFETSVPNQAGDTAHTVVVSVPGDVVLSPIDWTGTVTYDYKLNGGTKADSKVLSWDPGAWTINGAQVYINYMPYGDNISRIIYAANEGGLNATVTVDAFDDMGNSYSFDAGAVPANSVTKLSQAIDEGLRAEGFSGSGKVAMRLTFTAPDRDIEVYSAYNVGGSDRGTVVNTSNGRTFFYGLQAPLAPPPPPAN